MDKEMLGGLHLEEDIWTNCVAIILGLIEDSLIDDDNIYTRKPRRQRKATERDTTFSESANVSPAVTSQASLESLKRKRSFSEDLKERKLKRMSENLANDMARSLSVVDSTMEGSDSVPQKSSKKMVAFTSNSSAVSPTFLYSNINRHRQTPSDQSATAMNMTPSSRAKFDQLIRQEAERLGMSEANYRHHFGEQRYKFQERMGQLQDMIHQNDITYDKIKTSLHMVLTLAEEMMGNQTTIFMDVFPEWRSWETLVQKLTIYVQCIDDMKQLLNQDMQPSTNLIDHIKDLSALVETRSKLYDDLLSHNGLEWKAMGLPVDNELLNDVKQWFLHLCSTLLDELDIACSTLQEVSMDDEAWSLQPENEEQLMECLLQGIEVVASIFAFIGITNNDISTHCYVLATVYGQWISECLENLNQEQTGDRVSLVKKPQQHHQSNDYQNDKVRKKSARVDLRLMQKMDFMVRILGALQVMKDFNNKDNDHHSLDYNHPDQEDDVNRVRNQQLFSCDDEGDTNSDFILETFTDMLVEITVRAIAVIETHRSLHGQDSKGTTANIMARPMQSAYIYMEEALLSFADKVVELAGREWIDGSKVQRLHLFLEDMELLLAEDS